MRFVHFISHLIGNVKKQECKVTELKRSRIVLEREHKGVEALKCRSDKVQERKAKVRKLKGAGAKISRSKKEQKHKGMEV